MTEPRRLVEGEAPGAELLSAARAYRPPAPARRRVQRMLGLPVVLSLGATLSAALASTSAKVLIVAALATAGGGAVAYRAVTRNPSVAGQRRSEVTRARAPAPMLEPATTGTSVARETSQLTPVPPSQKRLIRSPHRRLAEVAIRRQRTIAPPSEPLPAVAPSPPEPGIAVAPEPLPAVAAPAVHTWPAATGRPAATAPAAATAPPAVTASPALVPLAAELALLEAAESALRKGRAGQALARLQEHRRAFPNSALAEEAAVLHIAALFGADQRAAARTEAARFLTRSSGSLLADRVRSMLAADSDSASTPPKGDHP